MKLKVGDTVQCIHAATFAYKVGRTYDVVLHPEVQGPAIRAEDGHLDLPSLVISKFEKVTKK